VRPGIRISDQTTHPWADLLVTRRVAHPSRLRRVGWEAFDVAFPTKTPPPVEGQCPRLRQNWSLGQSNFASRCAMLRMARFRPNCWLRRVNSGGHMTRVLTSVGGQMRVQGRGAGDEQISNRNKVRIEIGVTHSKQTVGTDSNRNSFRGSREQRKGGRQKQRRKKERF
jgi:hypothetical protein